MALKCRVLNKLNIRELIQNLFTESHNYAHLVKRLLTEADDRKMTHEIIEWLSNGTRTKNIASRLCKAFNFKIADYPPLLNKILADKYHAICQAPFKKQRNKAFMPVHMVEERLASAKQWVLLLRLVYKLHSRDRIHEAKGIWIRHFQRMSSDELFEVDPNYKMIKETIDLIKYEPDKEKVPDDVFGPCNQDTEKKKYISLVGVQTHDIEKVEDIH